MNLLDRKHMISIVAYSKGNPYQKKKKNQKIATFNKQTPTPLKHSLC